MRIVRFQDSSGAVFFGERVGEDTAKKIEGNIYDSYRVGEETTKIAKLLAPVEPRTTFCIGLNYRAHAAESGKAVPELPVVFMKGANAVQNPGDPIVIPTVEPDATDYECELAIVIGRAAKNVSEEDALLYVLGYTCANDVSGRIWQMEKGGGQWSRGKTFDTFCPLGPDLVTPDEIADPNDLRISTVLNGEVMQDSSTKDMIFNIPALIRFLSLGTTLLPGTVILTGTPQGVGFARDPKRCLRAGDEVTVEIEKIGKLTNPVILES